MIQSIDIENFQSHKKTHIDFSPGVTSIIGSSDSGKTAVLRALNWVINNRPGGDAFRSNWGGETNVRVSFDDSRVIRTKSKKDNLYALDADEFKAFGQGVPQEILNALNMDDENIQAQMDSPFLFSASDGEVARRLNQAANLEKIDTSQSFVHSKIRSCSASLKQISATIENLDEEISQIDFIEKADEKLKWIEELEDKVKFYENDTSNLDYTLAVIRESDEKLSNFDFIDPASDNINDLFKLLTEFNDNSVKVEELTELIEDIEEADIALQNPAHLEGVEENWQILINQSKEASEKIKETDDLVILLKQHEAYCVLIEKADEKIENWQKKFDKLMPEQCPLCGK